MTLRNTSIVRLAREDWPNLPCLRSVTLVNIHAPWLFDTLSGLHSLTFSDIWVETPSKAQISQMLASCPNLTYLALDGWYPVDIGRVDTSTPADVALLSKLRVLKLWRIPCTVVTFILRVIHAPSLTQMVVHCGSSGESGGLTAFDALMVAKGQLLSPFATVTQHVDIVSVNLIDINQLLITSTASEFRGGVLRITLLSSDITLRFATLNPPPFHNLSPSVSVDFDDASSNLGFLHSIPTLSTVYPTGAETELLRVLPILFASEAGLPHSNLSRIRVEWNTRILWQPGAIPDLKARLRRMLVERVESSLDVPKVVLTNDGGQEFDCMDDQPDPHLGQLPAVPEVHSGAPLFGTALGD